MLRKIIIGFLVAIIVLLCVWVFYVFFYDMFKPTVYLNPQIDLDSVQKVQVYSGVKAMTAYDEVNGISYIYTDKNKIKKILELLNRTPLVAVDLEKLKLRPSESSDCSLWFSGEDSKFITSISIYAGSFIKQYGSEQYYRSKNGRVNIRDVLREMTFD